MQITWLITQKDWTFYFSQVELEIWMNAYAEYEHLFKKKSNTAATALAENCWRSQKNLKKNDQVLSRVFHLFNICAHKMYLPATEDEWIIKTYITHV